MEAAAEKEDRPPDGSQRHHGLFASAGHIRAFDREISPPTGATAATAATGATAEGEAMQTQGRTEALLEVIESRLNEISERQHSLAVERARLNEQITPLRLGIVSPEAALALLKSKGIALRLPSAPSADRRPQAVVLKAVVSPRMKLAALPTTHSETA
jgi:cysteine sulfinate desulfinase/cysteine desulfurase-like protein